MSANLLRSSLPWLVPSVVILAVASGVVDRENLFGSAEEAAAAAAPKTSKVSAAATPAIEPEGGAQQEENLVARQANPAVSLAPTPTSQVALEPEAPLEPTVALTPETIVEPQAVPAPQPVREASLTPAPTFTPSFDAAAQQQCVDDLKALASEARVYFPSGGLTADESGIEQGRLLGLIALGCPGVQIMVEGHSDPSGDPNANLVLSERRAQAVIQRIAAAGIDTEMFLAKGYGDRLPSGLFGPEPSAYYDRRVEFSIVEPSAQVTTASRVLTSASPWAGAECVAELRQAVETTALFYSPGSVSIRSGDLDAAMSLAEKAVQCPGARLRVIGRHSADPAAREGVATGRLRAKALMAMMVGRGVTSDQIIIAAPSRASGGAADNGMPGSRVDFDIILEDG